MRLAWKEDFAYITYCCPHCNALNKPKNSEEKSLIPPVSASLVSDYMTLIEKCEVVNSRNSSSERGNIPTPDIKEEAAERDTI
ncbi:hypothetical protein Bca52824_093164 [Brassica carinata]|uniref:Lunapark domain-containing protein n=1 Tax=Brassica carinata TaxID=52824 RepID=A0A8X7P6K4_BRACI|nr:hypothetical protein Bca52824_093164 [Brassica carinata]